MRLSLPFFVLTAVTLFGCVSSETTRNTYRSQIGIQEIHGSSAQTAFGLIQQHRPSWIHQSDRDYDSYARGARREGFVVYVDGQRYGEGSSALSSISVSRVQRVDYLEADKALSRRGFGHEEGAIYIVTRYQAREDDSEEDND